MGFISEFLFGRLTKIQDEKIGELTTKVKSDNPSVNCTWTGEHQLSGQARRTVFILEGNNVGPYDNQLKSVHRIVDTIVDIIAQVDKELKGRPNIKQKFKSDWVKEFYVSVIMPYESEVKGTGGQFEIILGSIKEDEKNSVGLVWNNDRLTEIDVM